jgi:hypothetical protein
MTFRPTHRVIVENDEHEYALGTLVKRTFSFGESVAYAWYVDEEGMCQIMNITELEGV